MNITIRKMQPGDADALYRLLSDPEVMRHLEPPFDREKTETFLHHAGLTEPPLVYAAEASGDFIGYVIYHAYDADSVEIGWVLLPEYWGRGYASALTDRLIDRARQERKSVVIECAPAQEATKRIASKKASATAESATDWRSIGCHKRIRKRLCQPGRVFSFFAVILFPNENAPRCEANFSRWLTRMKRSVAALR